MDRSSLPRWGAAALVLVVVVMGIAAAPVVANAPGQSDATSLANAGTQVDADAVLLSIELQPDGDASWRIEHRLRLDDENTTAAFEDLQTDVERNESAYVSRFEDRMAVTVEEAASTTGREMALRNVSVATSTQQLGQTYGVLAYTFEWTNFAVVDGEELRAGDALAGLFLDADTSLLMAWPADYAMTDVGPEPTETREGSVVWRGPEEFGPDQPRIVVAMTGAGGPIDTSSLGLAVVVIVLLAGGLVWRWRARNRAQPSTPGPADEPATATDEEEQPSPPEELLSNEERVLALLEERGGRMKQQAVVEELGWTDAKTSQVVGKLRDSGQLEGFRLGRENVLRLPEADQSPAERAGHREGEPSEGRRGPDQENRD